MKNRYRAYWKDGASILLALLAFIYFYGVYPFHVCYQEQYQLFLFTSSYAAETLRYPGGLADYLSGFLTQFFVTPWWGAVILSVLLVLLQRLLWRVAREMGGHDGLYGFSFVPSIYYWYLLGDENYLLVGLVAPVLALLFFLPVIRLSRNWQWAYCWLLLPWLYFLLGISAWIFAGCCLSYGWRKGIVSWKSGGIFTIWVLVSCLLFPWVLKQCGWFYPQALLVFGVPFYRFPLLGISTEVQVYVASVMLLPVLISVLSERFMRQSSHIGWGIGLFALIGCAGGYVIRQGTNLAKEEILAYDYYTQHRDWKKVIRLADQKPPSSPLSVACLNLALCQEGQMAERMFQYYQNGVEGLLPSFTKDFTAPLVAGEIYYHIGFVNTARRFAFEAMESIPNYKKSVRAIKRLAETELINGEYAVARKYLRLLQQTLFYRDWATGILATLPEKNGAVWETDNPEWNYLRKYRTKQDFLFSEREPDMMLGFVFSQDETNRVAYEYLMAVCLLKKDLASFLKYYPLGKEIGYRQIPRSYQEAMVYAWGLNHRDMQGIPYPVSPSVLADVQAYGKIYTSRQQAEPLLRGRFSGTYWYYLHYRGV